MRRVVAGVPLPNRRDLTLRRAFVVVLLVAAWCALWGSFSVANLASGLLVGSAASFAGGPATGRVRLKPLAKLMWVVLVDLVESTGVVVREVLTPTDYTDEAIIAVPIDVEARRHLLFLYIAITVTPGTAVVAADDNATVLYLHVLHVDRRDMVAEHVDLLVSLVSEALPPLADAGPPTIDAIEVTG
ncbi:MAG: Na+/H+ antiporter subunit E [Ilumatobacter sp.]